jgi:DNA adenine methylase
MQPFIKWPGGKQDELKMIIPNLPKSIDRYIEPFVGGGAVYFAIDCANEYFINDKCSQLIDLYNYIKEQNTEFFDKLKAIDYNFTLLEGLVHKHSIELVNIYIEYKKGNMSDLNFKNFITSFIMKNMKEFNGLLEVDFNINLNHFLHELERNLFNKIKNMRTIEAQKGNLSYNDILDNIEAAFKSGFYMHFRHLYNNIEKYKISRPFATAIFYFIREYCYSSMFRYNKKGKFNVPYGGISYNRKNFKTKIDRLHDKDLLDRLSNTIITSLDFEEFLENIQPKVGDFMFIDPPYDTDFSTYANNIFDQDDQIRLANYLRKTRASFMLIIKNTDFIYSLYKDFNIIFFNKNYLVSFQNRNDKKSEHLLILNY